MRTQQTNLVKHDREEPRRARLSRARTARLTAHLAAAIALSAVALTGCRKQDMADQPRFEPMRASNFFADGTSARPIVAGTVAIGHADSDEQFYDGQSNGQVTATFPDHFPLPGSASYPFLATNSDGAPTDGPFPTSGEGLREVLARGQERFNIYCSMCHGQTGDGNGMIVQRGFIRPPSYHIDRLRTAPVGHIYQVITNGYGAMYSYGDRIPPADRWAIVAYIRTLQASAASPVTSLPKDQQDDIIKAASAGAAEDEATPVAAPAAPATTDATTNATTDISTSPSATTPAATDASTPTTAPATPPVPGM